MTDRSNEAKAAIRRHLLTAADMRTRLGVSDSTIARWVRAGRLPAPRYTPGGGRRVWQTTDVEAWEAALPTTREDAR